MYDITHSAVNLTKNIYNIEIKKYVGGLQFT